MQIPNNTNGIPVGDNGIPNEPTLSFIQPEDIDGGEGDGGFDSEGGIPVKPQPDPDNGGGGCEEDIDDDEPSSGLGAIITDMFMPSRALLPV